MITQIKQLDFPTQVIEHQRKDPFDKDPCKYYKQKSILEKQLVCNSLQI